MRIRAAVEGDLPAIAEVGHRTWPPTYEPLAGKEYVADGLARWWSGDLLRQALERTLVAEDTSGEIIGMTSFGPVEDVLIVWKLYVVPEAQGSGAGTALLRKVIDTAKGHHRAVRLAHIEGNDRAAKFYAHHGFTHLKREPDTNGGPDSVWLERACS
ncbi:GNAT family N-acetyltransferase [Amycolatopsis sp. NBC_00355]|uniref:GNAT family N-acetyltransferase n=1 Tax=Amycolatopsis sp. NBC_00355 TaxID=2975957 RepID=UPI002E25BF59